MAAKTAAETVRHLIPHPHPLAITDEMAVFILNAPPSAVRGNEDAHDKKCPHHHRRQKWLYSSSASLPPPFVENEDAQAILVPITITSAVR